MPYEADLLLAFGVRFDDRVTGKISEFAKLKSELVSDEELRRAKDQLKGSLMLSLESSTARMSNLARQEMYFDKFYGMDELIEKLYRVARSGSLD